MAELELEGLHPDGEHLVLVGADGRRYRVVISDALRAAVRRDRPRLEQIRSSENLRPRDIQSRIRAGAAVEDVAFEAGISVEHVMRYEGPVTAERTWVADQARLLAVGREADAPRLGDLVVDRLAARGVEPDTLDWTAVRRPGEPWELVLGFWAGDRERVARWRVDLQARSLHALDDEGRWLSEVELGAPSARRHLASVRARALGLDLDDDALVGQEDAFEPAGTVGDVETPGTGQTSGAPSSGAQSPGAQSSGAPSSGAQSSGGAQPSAGAQTPALEDDRTADLLEELRASRGVRHEVRPAIDDDAEGIPWDVPPPAHPPASAPHERPDAAVLALRVSGTSTDVAPPADTSRKPRGRARRQSVPSWDEIVFGAKPE